ncbi:MAG: AsmA family protein [Myxococcota bacterium]
MKSLRTVLIALGVVFGILVLGFVAVVSLVDLDALIAKYKEPALTAASDALGREVQVDTIGVSWFPVLGVRATDVSIAEAERIRADRPFVRAEQLSVGIEIWSALVSLGKDIKVQQVVLSKPEIHVVRLKDGSFNFSDIGASTGAPPPESKEPMDDSTASYLESATIGRIAVSDGRVVYENRMNAPGENTVAVEDIDLELLDVGLGKPLDVDLQMAVMAQAQNLELKVETGPLASKIDALGVPEVTRAEVITRALPLSSVAPFAVVSGADLSEAVLNMDVVGEPSASAITLSGPIDVENLRLVSGEQKGPPFAAGLTLGITLPSNFSAVTLADTMVRLGPAKVDVSGEVDLTTVGWKNVRLAAEPFSPGELVKLLPGKQAELPAGVITLNVTSNGSPENIRADGALKLDRLAYDAAGTKASGSAAVTFSADGAPADIAFEAKVDATPLALAGDGYEKASGVALLLAAKGTATDAAVKVSDLSVRAGPAALEGSAFYPLTKGRLTVALRTASLRPVPTAKAFGVMLSSLPPETAIGFNGRYQAPTARPSEGSVEVTELSLDAGRTKVRGEAKVARFSPLQADVRLTSPFLDIDALTPEASPEPAPKDRESGPLLPEAYRSAVVSIQARVERCRVQKMDLTDVDLNARLENGKLVLRRFDFNTYGGTFNANGTTLNMMTDDLAYDLRAQIQGVKAQSLLSQWTSLGNTLTGDLNSKFQVRGAGLGWEQIVQTVAGNISMEFLNGQFTGLNVVKESVLPLQQAVSFIAPSRVDLGRDLTTEFRRMAGMLELKDGQMRIPEKLTIDTPAGRMELTGAVGFDQKMSLQGSFDLPPDLIAKLSSGRLKVNRAVPVGVNIGCTVSSPCFTPDIKPTVATLTQAAAGSAVEDLAKKALGDALEDKKKSDPSSEQPKQKAKKRLKDALEDLF